MEPLEILCLDHVAIRVGDMEKSANWYATVLGLKRYQKPEWGDFPIFMLGGKTGIAIFPLKRKGQPDNDAPQSGKIDHFAFLVDNANFENAKTRFRELNLPYNLQDHTFFHSLYIKDPDGITVELTTLVVEEDSFY